MALGGWTADYPDPDSFLKSNGVIKEMSWLEPEYHKMAAWCKENAPKRKTATGISKFISAWLNRINPDERLDYSHIPIDQIALMYRHTLSNLTGDSVAMMSDRTKADIAARWNDDLSWWSGFFNAIKVKAEKIDPKFMPSRYKLNKLVGINWEEVNNELTQVN